MSPVRLRPVLIAAAILLYALLAHYSNLTGATVLGTTLAAIPLLAMSWMLARRARAGRLLAPLALLATVVLVLCFRQALGQHFALLDLLQQCGLYGLFAVGFGRSLRHGEQPLCARWAQMVHGELTPELARYTRSVTAAWTAFFLLLALASLGLYLFAPLRLWSLFANFLTLPLAVLMFLGEYLWRRRTLPPAHRTGLAESVRAYLEATRTRTASRL